MRSTAVRTSSLHAMQAQRVATLARQADDFCTEIAAARVLDAIAQNRSASFEDVVLIDLYVRDAVPGGISH